MALGTGAQFDLGVLAGGLGDADGIVTEDGVDVDLLGHGLEDGRYRRPAATGARDCERVGELEAEEHILLLGEIGIAEAGA